MKKIFDSYKVHFSEKKFVFSVVSALMLFVVSLFVNFYAGMYATERASNSVTDIVLSNIRSFDVDSLFIYGGFIIFIVITLFCLFEPKKLPFIIKSVSLFVLIRSLFITLTHIGPFPSQIDITSENFLTNFIFGGDLFFSGHTGLPFLMALIYWDNKIVRFFFIVMSLFFGTIVLLGHLHYTIDVLSAFFITYTIYHMARYLFKNDYEFFKKSL
ncbi:MAG: phosphatase PAP2-related protein [Candidatus Nomurabacteria bacterium]|nr:phosphatase PAP2-related protein [Candidatus Nomurabacteria bacterium]